MTRSRDTVSASHAAESSFAKQVVRVVVLCHDVRKHKFMSHSVVAAAKRFGNRLHGRFGIAVEFVDERLTTREAWQLLEQEGERRSKPEIDSLSAMLITESWLNDYAPD